jgi:hypothetical protein
MPELKIRKQEFIYLLDRINDPIYVNLMVSLLCKAISNIRPYEEDQFNAAKYHRVYDLLIVIKDRQPKWKLVYHTQNVEVCKKKAEALSRVYKSISFFVNREVKKENHFKAIYGIINSIDVNKNYTKNFRWFRKLRSNLKFVYDRMPKWALNYQESALPDLGNLREMTSNKSGYLCTTIHQLRLKSEFCDIINSIKVKKDFGSNAGQYMRIHKILQEVNKRLKLLILIGNSLHMQDTTKSKHKVGQFQVEPITLMEREYSINDIECLTMYALILVDTDKDFSRNLRVFSALYIVDMAFKIVKPDGLLKVTKRSSSL